MKKSIFALLAIAVLAAWLHGQEVVIRDAAPFTYAYLESRGSYEQMPDKINEFMGLFFQQGLKPLGNFFGMYLNSPGEVKDDELLWRLGFPVAADAAVAAPLRKGQCQATSMAVYLYVGPYEKAGVAYGMIMEFIDRSGYKMSGPAMEKYLDMDPSAVKPEELRTEINVPVEKK